MRKILPVLALALVAAGCARSDRPAVEGASASSRAAATRPVAADGASAIAAARAKLARGERYAALPDRGELVAYRDDVPAFRSRAYTWKAVSLSEAHAIDAIGGVMTLTAPDGHLIRLRYDHHVEHADGNWTWVGRPAGAKPGVEAIITFGDKAVFGTIPDGTPQPLRLMAAQGRTWMVQTDANALASLPAAHPSEPDAIPVPRGANKPLASGPVAAGSAPIAASAGTSGGTVIDVVLGYTNGFASRLGGQSQANTRLTNMIDIANQAYSNSGMPGRVRLVNTVQVTYSDTTDNDQALYDLTGYDCSGSSCVQRTVPAALQPLRNARDQYGADLVSLVRAFDNTTNGSCGVGWILGGGQVSIDSTDAAWAMSIVSDSNGTGPNSFPSDGYVCREETLAHEMGHNMGSTHDRATSQGSNGVLDSDEYGRYAYSFGYKTDASKGNFYTVMAYGDSGQTSYRVFSTPSVTTCGGYACGVADASDNARSLNQTMPVIAGFRATVVPGTSAAVRNDFDGDGKADLLWRNSSAGNNALWYAGRSDLGANLATVTDANWRVVGTGDLDGDGKADIVWRHASSGANAVWPSGDSSRGRALSAVPNLAWQMVGTGDFDGDGKDDLLWRHSTAGNNVIWHAGRSDLAMNLATVSDRNWRVVSTGDVDDDGHADIVWRNVATGANALWPSADYALRRTLAAVTNLAWQVVGTGDFDGDGKDDLLWRHSSAGNNVIWYAGRSDLAKNLSTVADTNWRVVSTGDLDGDGQADIVWRNVGTGGNAVWASGDSTRGRSLTAVTNLAWQVVGP